MLWLHRGLAVSDKSFTHFLLPQFSSSFLQVGRIPTSCSVFSRPHQMSRTVLTPQAPMGWLLIKVNALVICHGSISAMWCVQHFAGYEDGTGTSCWVPEIYSFFFLIWLCWVFVAMHRLFIAARGLSLAAVSRVCFLVAAASLVWEHRL